MTVRDVYKREVLGEGALSKGNDIESFSNENFLRFKYALPYAAIKMRTRAKTITNACSQEASSISRINTFR
jgi:hypothetical protein